MAFTIGELGKATGTKVETIRYYERIDLLPKPDRTAGNYRAYARVDLERLYFKRRARDLGFPHEQVRALLDLAYRRDQHSENVDELVEAHLADVARKITDLEALQRELGNLLSQCGRGTIAECRIIEALGPVESSNIDS